MSFHAYTPDYDLARKRLIHRRALVAFPGDYPRRQRHGTRSDPTLVVTVHPPQVTVEVEHHYTSGHAWMIDDDRDMVLDGVGVDDPALVGVLGEAELAELRAALDHPERWRPEVLAGLFEPRKGRGPHRVPVEEADALELGRSATADGRLPYLTLRVLRGERQIVWDHSFRGWPQERELEAVVVPADDAAVVAHFGAEGLAAVEWLEGQGLPHG